MSSSTAQNQPQKTMHGDAHGAAEQIARVAPRGRGLGCESGCGGRRLDIGGGMKRGLAPDGG